MLNHVEIVEGSSEYLVSDVHVRIALTTVEKVEGVEDV